MSSVPLRPARGLAVFDRRLLSVATVLGLVLVPAWASGYWLYSASLLLSQSVAVLSISFLIRFSGEVSIGHNFFVAVGAYTVAILQNAIGLPFIVGVPVAVFLSMAAGLVFAWPSRGLSGVYLVVATLALGLCVPEVLLYWSDLTGGYEGLFLDSTVVPGVSVELQQYYVALLAIIVAAFVVHRFRHSRIGLAILASRDHPHVAASFGMTNVTARLTVFAMSAAIAGLSGAVLAFTTSMVSPNGFTFWNAVTLLVGAVVSLYATRIYAAVIGAAFISLVPQVLSDYGPLISIIYGVALVGVILLSNVVVPQLIARIRRRRGRHV